MVVCQLKPHFFFFFLLPPVGTQSHLRLLHVDPGHLHSRTRVSPVCLSRLPMGVCALRQPNRHAWSSCQLNLGSDFPQKVNPLVATKRLIRYSLTKFYLEKNTSMPAGKKRMYGTSMSLFCRTTPYRYQINSTLDTLRTEISP